MRFGAGESIYPECSYESRIDELQRRAPGAGFLPVDGWTDARALFSVHYREVEYP